MTNPNVIKTQVVVIGSGPGGYTAAFRAADLGKQVVLIERYDSIGGVCLNVGCIPSKALLHAAKVLTEAEECSETGITFGKPKIDIKQLFTWKNSIITRLTGGLKTLAKQRKVEIVQGTAKFNSANEVIVEHDGKTVTVQFEQAIIAVGSRPVKFPFIPEDPRVFDSTGALMLEHVKGDMLILGGGIIGLEMGTVYDALGLNVSVVELMPQLIPGADLDLVKPLQKRMSSRFKNIWLETKVTKIEPKKDGVWVTFEGKSAPTEPMRFDSVLYSVGRRPNGDLIAADKAGVKVDERGFIAVDNQQRTNVAHIFAIGDVVGNPMLAHKAMPEARVAAEVIAGLKHYFEPKCIPSVAYTDPEVAWVGLTETQAKQQGLDFGKGVFPWAASGRALSIGRSEGFTKVIYDNKTHRILGCGIVGVNAGDLIAEAGLAIEMGCDADDIGLTIHPHPTLAETLCLATEAFEGTITDLYLPKKKE